MKALVLVFTCWLLSVGAVHSQPVAPSTQHLEMNEPSTAAYLKCVNQYVESLLPTIGDILPLNDAANRGFEACKDAGSTVARRCGDRYFKALKVATFQDILKHWVDVRDRLGLPVSDLPRE